MRFSKASVIASLPLLAAADVPEYQAQFENYLDQAQVFLGNVASKLPNPNKHDAAAAAEAKAGSLNLDILTLDNWKQTLYGPVKPESTTPEEWWVLITGGNKTCFGKATRREFDE